MKNFSFSLSTLLKVRIHKEEMAQKRLLEKYLLLQQELKVLEDLFQTYEQSKDQHRILQKNLRDTAALSQNYEYMSVMKKRIENQKKVVAGAKSVVDSERGKVIQAMHQRKIIENLRSKKFQEWEIEMNDEERKIFDELATIRFGRKPKARG